MAPETAKEEWNAEFSEPGTFDLPFCVGFTGGRMFLASTSLRLMYEIGSSPDGLLKVGDMKTCSITTARRYLTDLEGLGFVTGTGKQPRMYELTRKGFVLLNGLAVLSSALRDFDGVKG